MEVLTSTIANGGRAVSNRHIVILKQNIIIFKEELYPSFN